MASRKKAPTAAKVALKGKEKMLRARLNEHMKNSAAQIADFYERHASAYERLFWIAPIIEPAARVSVYEQVIGALDAGQATVESVQKYARERAALLARAGSKRSTAPLDGALEMEQLRMWCAVEDMAAGVANRAGE
jgi:hypothetical protein